MKRLDNMEKEYGEVIQKLEELNEKDESNPVPSMDAFRTMVRDVKEKKQKSIRHSNILFACVAVLFLSGVCIASFTSQVFFIIIQCLAVIPLPFVIDPPTPKSKIQG